MTMTPRVRKLALTTHVVSSIGWLGAVLVVLALAIIGLTTQDPQTVRGAYLVMEPIAWSVLIPGALASLLSGIVQSLATAWGLLRHYWVVFKLVINVLATIVLLLYMQTLSITATMAADPTVALADVRALGSSPRLHAILATVLLLVATVLAIYKPKGMTRYGQRKQRRLRTQQTTTRQQRTASSVP